MARGIPTRRRWAIAALAVALLLVFGGVGLWLIGAARLSAAARPLVLERLERMTGRAVSVAGPFEILPSLSPILVAEDVTLANAVWGTAPAMLRAERLEVRLQLLPLVLERRVAIDRLALAGAEILLERREDGAGNWRFGAEAPSPADEARPPPRATPPPALADLAVTESTIVWNDLATGRRETVRIEHLAWTAAGPDAPLAASAAGRCRRRRSARSPARSAMPGG